MTLRPIILASKSAGRRRLLSAAGVAFESRTSGVDEADIRANGGDPEQVATALAIAKARAVAPCHPAALVIGADQLLVGDGMIYGKAESLEEARATLRSLRGRRHRLLSAVALLAGGEVVFHHVGEAQLVMRDFSDAFLERYLDRHGESLLAMVGCYGIEAEGVQLFERIEGDWPTIIGLPLLSLLAALRAHGGLPP